MLSRRNLQEARLTGSRVWLEGGPVLIPASLSAFSHQIGVPFSLFMCKAQKRMNPEIDQQTFSVTEAHVQLINWRLNTKQKPNFQPILHAYIV